MMNKKDAQQDFFMRPAEALKMARRSPGEFQENIDERVDKSREQRILVVLQLPEPVMEPRRMCPEVLHLHKHFLYG
jgi:hypothetical protein